jgi:hypothetical protein
MARRIVVEGLAEACCQVLRHGVAAFEFQGASLYSRPVSELPIELPAALAEQLGAAFDIEGKLGRSLNEVGRLTGQDVAILGRSDRVGRQLADLGARVFALEWPISDGQTSAGAADAIVSLWDGFAGANPTEVATADRILRPGGRLLVVHDYGRDDVSRLLGERPQYVSWGRVNGPFLRSGFRIRVVHCWWTFPSVESAAAFVTEAFDGRGAEVAASLRRPRLSYNVAIYHRTRP